MTHDEFKTHWGRRRDEYSRIRAQVDAATLIDQMLAELEEATSTHNATLLNLTDAAAACGYNAESLGRMVRSGEIPNYGRKGAPRVRLGDLPRRARRRPGLRVDGNGPYDPVADAQFLRGH